LAIYIDVAVMGVVLMVAYGHFYFYRLTHFGGF